MLWNGGVSCMLWNGGALGASGIEPGFYVHISIPWSRSSDIYVYMSTCHL